MMALLISFSDCSMFQSMFIADLSLFSTENKPSATQIPIQDQPRPSKDSVQLHFPIPKPTLSAFKSDVATTTSTAAIPRYDFTNSHKKSLITIFGHKHEINNFIKKFDVL